MPASPTVLARIADAARRRVEAARATTPAGELRERALEAARRRRAEGVEPGRDFERALRRPGLSLICECKQASPSRGQIARGYDPVAIASDYEAGGAAAVSCLTEPDFFRGSLDDLRAVADAVSVPVLRKDFVVDEYMLYQASLAGASAALLIVGILSDEQLVAFQRVCDELGIAALVEAYTAPELERALASGARVVGVNNRDLRDFSVDFDHARRLREMVPPECAYVAESGVSSLDDVATVAAMGADAALVGEYLMRSPDRPALLGRMRAAAREAAGAQGAPTPDRRGDASGQGGGGRR
jgi:indole-3-glycerol phosphate synthase